MKKILALASESAMKTAPVGKVFAAYNLIAKASPSGVSENPMAEETLRGAFNRLRHIQEQVPDADLHMAIESGLTIEHGEYIDRAYIVIAPRGQKPRTYTSEGITFPRQYVDKARNLGFDKWTAGKVMQREGLVTDHADPHKILTGKSRADFIADILQIAKKDLGL